MGDLDLFHEANIYHEEVAEQAKHFSSRVLEAIWRAMVLARDIRGHSSAARLAGLREPRGGQCLCALGRKSFAE